MLQNIEIGWENALAAQRSQPYYSKLMKTVEDAYVHGVVYPPSQDVFVAFSHCPLPQVKIVILGQDPYHGPYQAHGLAFSVPDTVKIPPSLQNIYKEIKSDIGTNPPVSGNLTRWADQGVLLLNSVLTVKAGEAGSHHTFGWETFTDAVIKTVSNERTNVVFLLWGTYAIKKRILIDETKHLVLTAPHPSPLSAHRGFLGCRHFSQTNTYLQKHGKSPIAW
jgi:uracil-DNA glycosylase